ncbi:DUF3363 domain-containing protein [Acidovorax sp. ACV01]|uniref:DUF3363 domain-containing protein n=1 Tax=Acidovorax sp. ACV01 TaxID=2769311 RepID=UPI00351C112E
MAGSKLGANARRVVIKSRFVVLKKAGAQSVATHLRYIERDGTTRDGQRGQAYGADTDTADLKEFEERGRGDRHQFRFIVSVEDAAELEDLRGYSRELMARMEADLETRLDWVAVDHWDTDNPHTHIVLRGRVGQGRSEKDLVIAPDYMAHGMRQRASGLATEWLGPRTEQEILRSVQREVGQERLTGLDRSLQRQAVAGVVDLGETAAVKSAGVAFRSLMRARLQKLEALSLAERLDSNRWQLVPGMQQMLTALGERGDILRTLHRAMKGEPREFVYEEMSAGCIEGCVVAKGLADELKDRGYLIVDGIDGRAHYVTLGNGKGLTALHDLPLGGIVEVKPAGQERAVDQSISKLSHDGYYRISDHAVHAQSNALPHPVVGIEVHVRRLEALRRMGIVERVSDGLWKIPPDLVQQARQHDLRQAAGPLISLRSHLPIGQQVRAVGATWLDRKIAEGSSALAVQGFGSKVREILDSRLDFLVEKGLAERRGPRTFLASNLLVTLRDMELVSIGRALQDRTQLNYRPLHEGEQFSGVYRQSLQLVSARFAILDNGQEFTLCPWRAVIERHHGLQVTAVLRGNSVSWQWGRKSGISV